MKRSHKTYGFTILLLLTLLISPEALSQQSQMYTHYFFDRFLLNPAACGSNGYSALGVTVKDQWTGIKETPFVQMLSAQARVPRTGLFGTRKKRPTGIFSPENVGVGLSLYNDVRGYVRTTGARFAYSYHIKTETEQLSFGLALNLFQLFMDRNKILTEYDDDFINAARLNSLIPDAAAGIYYTTRYLYAGLSASDLFQSYLALGGSNTSSYRIERQYNLMAGYIFELDRYWSLSPSALVKMTELPVAQMDVNATLYYDDRIWGGVSYRTGGGGVPGGVNVMFGAAYKQYFFGYAFDYVLSNIRRYSFGSHEVMLAITFGQNDRYYQCNFSKIKRKGKAVACPQISRRWSGNSY
ncbi:MAG: PorP/SprF family type IX secretion system membrane protein [Bacteroidales bacterium]|jgi:type IX secretion system PorP/SprF family membrane protein|nr:PorP/SprF family type IX secretion system membrane protein [Bacteroidales bacterium]